MAPVTPGFFETMNIPLLAGRVFVAGDMDPASSARVIVNEAFAARYFGREPPVGRTFEGRFSRRATQHPQEVVGVVADTRYDLRKPAVAHHLYSAAAAKHGHRSRAGRPEIR